MFLFSTVQNRRMNYIRWWDWVTLCCLVLLGCPAAIVGDEGSDYLDSKQAQVEQMAIQAIENYNQQCELLASCNNVANCSHSVCAPLVGDREGLTCRTVHNNTYCSGKSSTPCTSMNLDYRRSYVRVAATTNLNSVDTMLSICPQRELDPLIKSYALLDPSVITRLYFAPMDGSWRVIPGSAQSLDNCNIYDPRIRPWFRTAISVMKVVTVLIDIGASMNSNLPPNYGPGTMLQAAQNMATQLLKTLSANDHVNIIVFNSTGAYQLSPEAILVLDHNTTVLPELQPLLDALDSQTVESQYRQSNLTAAILAALPNFESNPSAAKVIVVISDGMFATLGNVSLPSTGLSGVKIFLYVLPQSPELGNNTLIKQLCAVGGHYEPILKNLENPLLALNKFFSYLANLKRIETNALPQYSSLYQDFEQIGGYIITVTKPVFSAWGDLIGVAGLTIYPELLGNLTVSVNNALQGRVTGYNAPAKQIVLTAANCSSMNETTQACGADTTNYVANGGLCMKTDLTSTIQNIACCGACSVSNGSRNLHHVGAIAGIVIGSLVGLLLLVGFGLCTHCAYQKRKKRKNKVNKIMHEFPGGPDDSQASPPMLNSKCQQGSVRE